jgi:ferrous iron transport protein A
MTKGMYVPLTMLRAGQSGKIVDIQGGPGLINRLNALGIRLGKRITKVSSMLMRGPVTVRVGGAQVAMGFGMARRVIIEVAKGVP